MPYEVQGGLVAKYPRQFISDKFQKREFVIAITEDINGHVYTNYAKFQLVQNKCDILDRFNEGDMIKVSFNIKGNRYEKDGKVNYISNLDAWRIENVGVTSNAQPTQSSNTATGYTQNSGGSNSNSKDDLSFRFRKDRYNLNEIN